MMLGSSKLLLFTLASALIAPAAAQAGVTFTSAAYDSAPPGDQTLVVDFDHDPAPGFTFAGGGVYQGLSANVAAPPSGDDTKYEAVLGGDSGSLTSVRDLSSLSLYIGSIDKYNTITFSGTDGFSRSLTGDELYQPADGNQSAAETNRRFDFHFDNVDVNKVTFQSTANSFEFDNIAAGTVSAAPEPGAWALMILGVGMMGWMLGVRKRLATDHEAKLALRP